MIFSQPPGVDYEVIMNDDKISLAGLARLANCCRSTVTRHLQREKNPERILCRPPKGASRNMLFVRVGSRWARRFIEEQKTYKSTRAILPPEPL
jgi:hypothetical protein